jgi:hypothetical protein
LVIYTTKRKFEQGEVRLGSRMRHTLFVIGRIANYKSALLDVFIQELSVEIIS